MLTLVLTPANAGLLACNPAGVFGPVPLGARKFPLELQLPKWQPRNTDGYDLGAPLNALVPSAWVTLNPVAVTLMHCVALVPQRLFCTTYRPPWICNDANWSQITVSACATPTVTTAA